MRPFIYIIILLFAFILFKAFYLDSLPTKSDVETNATVEEVVTAPVPSEGTKENANPSSWADNSKRPIDKLGDKIADKFKGKL